MIWTLVFLYYQDNTIVGKMPIGDFEIKNECLSIVKVLNKDRINAICTIKK